MSWTRVQAQRPGVAIAAKLKNIIISCLDLEDTADLSNNHGEKL